ncbi:MAG: hypothetical protein KA479_12530 [Saprospiraceae bacterium]|jgi:hypothetical protein|nr:hypothetical protein [Saprospiraceae bacterium]
MLFRIIFLAGFCLILHAELYSQGPLQRPRNPDYPGANSSNKLVRRSSFVASIGSGYLSGNTDHIGNIGLGEISYSYALSRKLAVGVGLLGSMLCNEAYFNEQGQIVSNSDDLLGEDCDRAWALDATIMALGRYFPFSSIGTFGQIGLGYSLDGQAPAYSIGAGYFQPVYSQLGLFGVVRYANIIPLSNTPDFVQSTGGLKLEIGLGWNL